jgi:hypothetical protein
MPKEIVATGDVKVTDFHQVNDTIAGKNVIQSDRT